MAVAFISYAWRTGRQPRSRRQSSQLVVTGALGLRLLDYLRCAEVSLPSYVHTLRSLRYISTTRHRHLGAARRLTAASAQRCIPCRPKLSAGLSLRMWMVGPRRPRLCFESWSVFGFGHVGGVGLRVSCAVALFLRDSRQPLPCIQGRAKKFKNLADSSLHCEGHGSAADMKGYIYIYVCVRVCVKLICNV